jgi:hypothetical protein
VARTPEGLPQGPRLADFISLGVIAKAFPLEKIYAVLETSKKASIRQRELPAQLVVYYVIALGLYMQVSYREVLRCLLEGVQWLLGPTEAVKVAGKSGISQARTRLGCKPLQQLHDQLVQPIATKHSRGAWYRNWHLVSLDGSTLEVADQKANAKAFGRPNNQRGQGAFPLLRFVSLVENGTHVLFATQMGGYHTGEPTLAKPVLEAGLRAGMLCLADRGFFSYQLWQQARSRQAELLWRVKRDIRLPCEQRLADGSYLSRIYAQPPSRRRKNHRGTVVRVIEYQLDVEQAEPLYRLVTSVLDPEQAPAQEFAALYQQRWEIETAFDELKTHLRGSKILLRSKTPELVRQEFYGLLMAHFAIRSLMHEAALKVDEDPDRLSFLHAVRVVRRKLPALAAIPPSEAICLS